MKFHHPLYICILFCLISSCTSDTHKEKKIIEKVLSFSAQPQGYDSIQNEINIETFEKANYKEALANALLKKASYFNGINRPDSAYVILNNIEKNQLLKNSQNPESKFRFQLLKIELYTKFEKYENAFSLINSLKKEYKGQPKFLFRIFDMERFVIGNTDNKDYQSISKAYYYSKLYLKSIKNNEKRAEYEDQIIDQALFMTPTIANYFILLEDIDSSKTYTREMMEIAPRLKNKKYKAYTYTFIGNSCTTARDFKQARLYLDSARTIVNRYFPHNLSVQANFNYGMTDFFEMQNMKDSVTFYYKKQNNIEKYLQTNDDLSKKNFDKEYSGKTKSLENQNRKFKYIISLVGIILCISIYFIFYYYNRLKKIKLFDDKDIATSISIIQESTVKRQLFDKIIQSAENNTPELVSLFTEYNNDFINNLKKMGDGSLRSSEIRFFIYLYLNFSTKEIAKYTNTSVRTVQTRKYNLRKKYNIPPNTDLYIWVKDLV